MTNRTVEKSANLSTVKVVLGHDAAPLAGALQSLCATNPSDKALQASARPALTAREQISALEELLAASTQQIDKLQQQLTELQHSEVANKAALTELQDNLAERQSTAQQRGYADGSAAAAQVVQDEWQQKLALWEQGLAELALQNGEYRQQLLATIADIALAATTKIIGEHLADAQQIGSAVEHIVYESGLSGAMKIFLAPTHYEEISRAGGITLTRLAGRQIELQPDPRISYGGCLLETAGAVVDGRYEVQLKKLQAIVAEFHPTPDITP